MESFFTFLLYIHILRIIGVNANPFFGRDVVPAQHSNFPFAVSLGDAPANSPNHHFCGGVLISSIYVLTAAQCIEGNENRPVKDFRDVKVTIGSRNSTGDKKYDISGILLYTTWAINNLPGGAGPDHLNHDLIILRLDENVDNPRIPTARLTYFTDRELAGRPAVTVGWGHTIRGQPINLHGLTLNVISRQTAENNYRIINHQNTRIPGNNLFTTRESTFDFAPGDYGSPLVVEGRLAGINTHSVRENMYHPIVQRGHASVNYYRDFIEAFADEELPSSPSSSDGDDSGFSGWTSDGSRSSGHASSQLQSSLHNVLHL